MNPLSVLNDWSLTAFSGSNVKWQRAGITFVAVSFKLKNDWVAESAKIPLIRAGGNGSLIALKNELMSTFWRICIIMA